MVRESTMPETARVVVSASIAFDYIMTFPGSFKDHILPDKTHVLSVSFLVDSMRRQRGGVGGNIAYNLALLGEHPALVGGAGTDFADYQAAFTALGVDTRHVLIAEEEFTASCFITTDLDNNQFTGFFPGAMSRAVEVSVTDVAAGAELGLVGADDPAAMRRHVAEFAAAGCDLLYDPSQQIIVLPPEDLIAGIDAAHIVIGNDYELGMIARKTGLSVDDIAAQVPVLIITYGEAGSEIRIGGDSVRIPATPPMPLADPTGGGDAYRAGLIKGLLLGVDWPIVGRLAALTATYAIERHGTQEHTFTPETFAQRFDAAFPDYAGAVPAEAVSRQLSAIS